MATYYVSIERGNNYIANGTFDKPFYTVEYALNYSQTHGGNSGVIVSAESGEQLVRYRNNPTTHDVRTAQEIRTGIDQVLRQSYVTAPITISSIVDPEVLAEQITARFPETLVIGGSYGNPMQSPFSGRMINMRSSPYNDLLESSKETKTAIKFPEARSVMPLPD